MSVTIKPTSVAGMSLAVFRGAMIGLFLTLAVGLVNGSMSGWPVALTGYVIFSLFVKTHPRMDPFLGGIYYLMLIVGMIIVSYLLPLLWFWKIAAFFGLFWTTLMTRAIFQIIREKAQSSHRIY
jgi:hypothetical protein